MESRKKIGIITWHYYTNYGSMLQTYALVKTVRSLGYDARVLNYHNPKFGHVSSFKTIIKNILGIIPRTLLSHGLQKLYFPKDRFKKFFKETTLVYSTEQLYRQCKDFNAIICGSDQIWAPNVFNPVYFLDFVPNGKLKISYAASIGLNNIPENLKNEYKKLLSRIDFISVRESRGKVIIKEICGLDSTVVLDPTLLVRKEDWSELSIAPQFYEPYIFCYFLRDDHKYSDAVKKFAREHKTKVIGISLRKQDKDWMEILDDRYVGPREFLGLIDNASVVITDSYHGTIFSLLFHTQFITFERFNDDETICQNSRLNQLIDNFSIAKNVVKCNQDTVLEINDIQWEDIDDNLSYLREKSLTFLKNSLREC